MTATDMQLVEGYRYQEVICLSTPIPWASCGSNVFAGVCDDCTRIGAVIDHLVFEVLFQKNIVVYIYLLLKGPLILNIIF